MLSAADAVRAEVLSEREHCLHQPRSITKAVAAGNLLYQQQLQQQQHNSHAAAAAATSPQTQAVTQAATGGVERPTTPVGSTPICLPGTPTTPPGTAPLDPASWAAAKTPPPPPFTPPPRTEAFPGRYYSVRDVWQQVITVSAVSAVHLCPWLCAHKSIACGAARLFDVLQDTEKDLRHNQEQELSFVRRPLGLLMFEACGQEVVLLGNRLEDKHFLGAVRRCEREPDKAAKMERVLDYLERAFRDICRYYTLARPPT